MAAGELLRAELNTTTPSGSRSNLLRAELSSVALAGGVLLRAQATAVLTANGLLLRVESSAGVVIQGRMLRAEASSVAAPVQAPPDQVGVEPFVPQLLQGSGGNALPSSRGWSQISGPTVSLSGSGDSATYTPPGLTAGAVLVFQYQVDGATATVKHTVLSASERGVTSGAFYPIRPY